jgi:uncharacterized glyoxalase superfamily protein PhnB
MARKSKAKTAKKKSAGRKAATRRARPAARAAKKAVKRPLKKAARPKARRPKVAKRTATRKTSAAAGLQSVTPYLVVSSCGRAIDFYKKAFGAVELYRMPTPDNQRVLHATLKIGGSNVMLSDEFPEHGGNRGPDIVGSTTVTIHLNVPNADKAFAQAVQAGATAILPPADVFWGDRFGKLRDPFGHEWSIAHHVRDVSPAEIAEATKRLFAS